MNREEKNIIGIQRDVYELAIKEKFRKEFNQNTLNSQIKKGYAFIHNKLYKMQEITFDDHYSFMIPKNFQKMREEFIIRKYPQIFCPKEVYTNYYTTINIALSNIDQEIEEQNFQLFINQIIEELRNIYRKNIMITNGFDNISGNVVGDFDFITTGNDTNIYNHFFFIHTKKNPILLVINCPEDQQDLWRPLAYGIMSSMKEK